MDTSVTDSLRTKSPHLRPPFECVALTLQGGGALGAYQAGVYQALDEAGIRPGCNGRKAGLLESCSGAINSWNRLAISRRTPAGSYPPRASSNPRRMAP